MSEKITLQAVVPCVNMPGELQCTLPNYCYIFDQVYVVTTPADEKTKAICNSLQAYYGNVVTVETDAFYRKNAKFNRGLALNEGFARIEAPQWICCLDVDTLVSPEMRNVDLAALIKTDIYRPRGRKMWRDYPNVSFTGLDFDRTWPALFDWEELEEIPNDPVMPYGWFQLFSSEYFDGGLVGAYPSWPTAAESDTMFHRKFRTANHLPLDCIHLGVPAQLSSDCSRHYGVVANDPTKGSTRICGLQRYMGIVAKLLPAKPLLVEVGSYAGCAAEVFAQYAGTLWCVDSYNLGLDMSLVPLHLQVAERAFDKIATTYPNIVKVRKDSIAAAADFEDGSLDLVYIDACHTYAAVRTDIQAWLPKVKPGGVIGGHDYGHPAFPGVRQAVQEVFASAKSDGYCNWMAIVQREDMEDVL